MHNMSIALVSCPDFSPQKKPSGNEISSAHVRYIVGSGLVSEWGLGSVVLVN